MFIKNSSSNANNCASETVTFIQEFDKATDILVTKPMGTIKEFSSAFHRLGGALGAATGVTVEFTIWDFDEAKQDEDGGSRCVWIELLNELDLATFQEFYGPASAFRITATGSVPLGSKPAKIIIAFA